MIEADVDAREMAGAAILVLEVVAVERADVEQAARLCRLWLRRGVAATCGAGSGSGTGAGSGGGGGASSAISTRRFCSSGTPSPVGTAGSASPTAMPLIALAGTPCATSASLTACSRRSDSAWL
jgi:hypothetical protein